VTTNTHTNVAEHPHQLGTATVQAWWLDCGECGNTAGPFVSEDAAVQEAGGHDDTCHGGLPVTWVTPSAPPCYSCIGTGERIPRHGPGQPCPRCAGTGQEPDGELVAVTAERDRLAAVIQRVAERARACGCLFCQWSDDEPSLCPCERCGFLQLVLPVTGGRA
jgi:hypothetical protein